MPLYIDPYAITKDPTDLAGNCHNRIISYFQILLEAIHVNDSNKIKRLISGHFSEPNEIHLGVSKKARGGRGIGKIQERHVIEALATSNSAKRGVIQSIQELELHIQELDPTKYPIW